MNDFVMPLMLGLDVSSLTMSLVNIASGRGAETALADSIEAALQGVPHLRVQRNGDTVVARADSLHPGHVAVLARVATAPPEGDPLAYVEMGRLFGPGASDAKGALAAVLKLAAVGPYLCDVTFVFRTAEQQQVAEDVTGADFALLAEPTGSRVHGDDLGNPWARKLTDLTDVAPVGGQDADGLGVPAVVFGPGDPSLAGTPDEHVPTAELSQYEFVLRQWLRP